jgi:hypothetical protein
MASKQSAIYKLKPLQRKFVLMLPKTNYNQGEAYSMAYNQPNRKLATASASTLMKSKLIKDAIAEQLVESDVIEAETLGKVLKRFVEIAEKSGKDSDRIRANELIAKIHPSKYLRDSEGAQNITIIADNRELESIRNYLKENGKMISPRQPKIPPFLIEKTAQNIALDTESQDAEAQELA